MSLSAGGPPGVAPLYEFSGKRDENDMDDEMSNNQRFAVVAMALP